MLIVDANVLVSAVLGRSNTLVFALAEQGVELLAPEAQVGEARRVLIDKLGRSSASVDYRLDNLAIYVRPLEPFLYESVEAAARARLGPRGQSDWPVLAAALALEADIWSNDRGFFGVGVAVWTTRNVGLAAGK